MHKNIIAQLEFIAFRVPTDAEWLFIITLFLSIITSFFFIPQECLSTYILHISFLCTALIFIFISDLFYNKLTSLIFFVIGIFVIGFLMAFRNKTAIDDVSYEFLFNEIVKNENGDLFFKSQTEKLFLIVNYLISYLGITNYCHSLTIVSYLSFLFWAVAIWQFRGKCNLSIITLLIWSNYYFFVLYAGLVRLFMALPLALFAFNMIAKGKFKNYIIITIVASLIHRSAFVLILLLPLFHKKIMHHWIKYVVCLFFLMPLIFVIIAKVLVPILGSKYSIYGNLGELSVSLGSFDTLPFWGCGIYYSQFIKNKEDKKIYTIGMVVLSLSIIFSICSSLVGLGRLVFYANLGILIIASFIFKQKPVGPIEKFLPCLFVVYSFVYVVHTNFLNPVCVYYLYPYRTYLFE